MFNLLFRFCYLFFSFRFWLCFFFSKLESFGLSLFLDFFVFLIVGKPENGLQKNKLSSFNQVKTESLNKSN